MKKVDVLITFEHRNRELESAVKICEILKKRGYSAEITQIGWKESICKFHVSPKVLVVPWCYDDKDLTEWQNYRGHFENGELNIVNLHCEQLTYKDAIDFCLPKGAAKDTYHCSWGKYFTDNLIACGVDNRLIVTTGSPRLDFFKPGYAITTKAELAQKHGLDDQKKWVLFVGNFSQMYIDDARIKELSERGITDVQENKALAERSFDEISDWIRKLCDSEESGNLEIIYRPHPSEKKHPRLAELEATCPSFHVIHDGAIREWYQTCDLAFVWCSTSSVEAAYSGIPVYSLRPCEIPADKQIDLVELLEQITNYSDMQAVIDRLLTGKPIATSDAFLDGIEFYYGKKENDACQKTVDAIEKLIHDDSFCIASRKVPTRKALVKYVNYYIKLLLRKLHIMQRMKKWEIINRDIVTESEYAEIQSSLSHCGNEL